MTIGKIGTETLDVLYPLSINLHGVYMSLGNTRTREARELELLLDGIRVAITAAQLIEDGEI